MSRLFRFSIPHIFALYLSKRLFCSEKKKSTIVEKKAHPIQMGIEAALPRHLLKGNMFLMWCRHNEGKKQDSGSQPGIFCRVSKEDDGDEIRKHREHTSRH